MNETMVKIASFTVPSGGQASVTFTNIPQNFTDLKLYVSARTGRTTDYLDDMDIQFNNDSSASYSTVTVQNNQGSTQSLRNTGQTSAIRNTVNSNTSTSGNMSCTEILITNYTSSIAKLIQTDTTANDNNGHVYAGLASSVYTGTSPITQIKITGDQSGFLVNSEFTLYGLKNQTKTANNYLKATGGTVTTDGTYIYHTFTSTGTFQPNNKLLVESLVIAGGGGGGSQDGAGGGAGGILYVPPITMFNQGTSYAVTVGAGGSGGTSAGAGTQGNNSIVNGLTAIGGGGGAGRGTAPTTGGSGGGGNTNGGAQGPASATQTSTNGGIGYGNAGGGNGGVAGSGGGGGAGAVGGAAVSGQGGNGGAGTSVFSQWGLATNTGQNSGSLFYYAGGGAGGYEVGPCGYGGIGGGGDGRLVSAANSGTSNTGGGGGAAGWSGSGTVYAGGSGGSGLVILRYKA
jgi:hypothetical protein